MEKHGAFAGIPGSRPLRSENTRRADGRQRILRKTAARVGTGGFLPDDGRGSDRLHQRLSLRLQYRPGHGLHPPGRKEQRGRTENQLYFLHPEQYDHAGDRLRVGQALWQRRGHFRSRKVPGTAGQAGHRGHQCRLFRDEYIDPDWACDRTHGSMRWALPRTARRSPGSRR